MSVRSMVAIRTGLNKMKAVDDQIAKNRLLQEELGRKRELHDLDIKSKKLELEKARRTNQIDKYLYDNLMNELKGYDQIGKSQLGMMSDETEMNRMSNQKEIQSAMKLLNLGIGEMQEERKRTFVQNINPVFGRPSVSYDQGKGFKIDYKKKQETASQSEKTAGAIMAQGRSNAFGDFVEMDTREKAVNYALERHGPNWQRHPEIVRAIEEAFPTVAERSGYAAAKAVSAGASGNEPKTKQNLGVIEDGRTATNPQTGEIMQKRNGVWIKIQ